MSDFEIPSAFITTQRKARKMHKCCECHQPINVSEIYQYCSGIWDSVPSSYKTCLSCVTLISDYLDKTGEELGFGELKEAISDVFYTDYGIKEFLVDYPENKDELKKLFYTEFN